MTRGPFIERSEASGLGFQTFPFRWRPEQARLFQVAVQGEEVGIQGSAVTEEMSLGSGSYAPRVDGPDRHTRILTHAADPRLLSSTRSPKSRFPCCGSDFSLRPALRRLDLSDDLSHFDTVEGDVIGAGRLLCHLGGA